MTDSDNSKLSIVYNSHGLDDDTVALYCDAFKLKAKEGMKIQTEDLAQVLWSLGMNPTEAQLKHICLTQDRTNTGFIGFQSFLKVMSDPKLKLQNDSRDDFIATFSVLDKGNTGFVDAKELLQMLTTLGDTLTVEEARRLVSVAPMDSKNRIDIHRFVDKMLAN